MIRKQKANNRNRIKSTLRLIALTLVFMFSFSFSSTYTVKEAQARCCVCCPQPALFAMHLVTRLVVINAYNRAFDTLRDRMLSVDWWRLGVEPLARSMTLELSTLGHAMLTPIGGFYDARSHGETVLDLQKANAASISRHKPSVAMCKFASLNKSIAMADTRANMVQAVLSEYSMKRALGQEETQGALYSMDVASRLRLLGQRHCNRFELGTEMIQSCSAGANAAGYSNKDINFTDAIDVPDTIDFDLAGDINGMADSSSNEQTNVISMKSLLYNAELSRRVGKRKLFNNYDGGQGRYLDWRSIVAKRSVAENSFDTLVGMKAASGEAVNPQYRAQLISLGIPAAEVDQWAKTAPSYWAQMELLTKTLYQNPDFYANLYDGPSNVMRQSATMEAITLMQMRDYYDSLIRSEMALALVLDNEVKREQDILDNTVTRWE